MTDPITVGYRTGGSRVIEPEPAEQPKREDAVPEPDGMDAPADHEEE
jgi:hypothetical protein